MCGNNILAMPKRKGYIIEQIADMENLKAADKEAQHGKVNKNRYIRRHNLQQEKDLKELQQMILTLNFPASDYHDVDLDNDNGKQRRIAKQSYHPWRIFHHAVMRVVGPDMYKTLIYDTCACIVGKGLHFGARRLQQMIRRYPEYKWFWKTDYKKYYQSIPHDVALEPFRRKFKDERFLKLLEIAILNYDSGQEIIDILNAEQAKKKRCSHRRLSKSANRKLHSKLDRSLYERTDAL